MENRTILITESDYKKLTVAICETKYTEYRNSIYIEHLEGELKRAEVMPSKKIPEDVITMNSRVLLTDLSEETTLELTLVFPDEGGKAAGFISVLAPIGTALIGYRVGDVFEWDTPAGRTRMRVDKILFQPEAQGNYD